MKDNSSIKLCSCLCGSVAFEIDGPLEDVIACHCSLCRKSTGHYLTAIDIRRENLRFTRKDGLKWFRSSSKARRGFCGTCGATLFFDFLEGDIISVAAGTLEGETGLSITMHIFVDDKGDYYDLSGSIPRFSLGRNSAPVRD